MARLIQQTIKTPLADEVLFGRLKHGGAVKVVVVQYETGIKVLGLEFPDGPVRPKPEKDVETATARREPKPRAKAAPRRASRGGTPKSGAPKGGVKGGEPAGEAPKASAKSVRTVPKVPLTKA
jgi:ATP-dependent Clp protease ATP-binding subunit ClpA